MESPSTAKARKRMHILHISGGIHHLVEIGWTLDVSGIVSPFIVAAGGNFDGTPILVAGEDFSVFLAERIDVDR